MSRKPSPRTNRDRELEEIYTEIPNIPACTGACSTACTVISMFDREWTRVKRAMGRTPRQADTLRCPMLSWNGRCMVYTVRPYICRLWGTTEVLACPEGCQPTRWLSADEARSIFERLHAVAGPGTNGPVGPVGDLWEAFAMDARTERAARLEIIRQNTLRERGL